MAEPQAVVKSAGGDELLVQALLAWWELNGRRDPAQKPWMFTAAGSWPQPGEQLAPYGIWIAEVMRCSAA